MSFSFLLNLIENHSQSHCIKLNENKSHLQYFYILIIIFVYDDIKKSQVIVHLDILQMTCNMQEVSYKLS